jgi:hypothetical protein
MESGSCARLSAAARWSILSKRPRMSNSLPSCTPSPLPHQRHRIRAERRGVPKESRWKKAPRWLQDHRDHRLPPDLPPLGTPASARPLPSSEWARPDRRREVAARQSRFQLVQVVAELALDISIDSASTPAAPPLALTRLNASHTSALGMETASSSERAPPACAVGVPLRPDNATLRSIAITATSPLLRVAPPLGCASVLSASWCALVPFPLHRSRRFPQFDIGARATLALPLCRTPHGQSAGSRHACPGVTSIPGFGVV